MKKIRVVIAKPGLDGHDRGAKVIARALRDAGMEVIYTGLRQTPEQIVGAALQEDADVIGLSILSGAHMHICPRVMELLKEKGLDDVLVVVGGIIPDVDIPKLQAMGVKGIFLPGSPMQQIIDFIQANAAGPRARAGLASTECGRGGYLCPAQQSRTRSSSSAGCASSISSAVAHRHGSFFERAVVGEVRRARRGDSRSIAVGDGHVFQPSISAVRRSGKPL